MNPIPDTGAHAARRPLVAALAAVLLAVGGCATAAAPEPPPPVAEPPLEIRDDLQAVFTAAGVRGAFAMRDTATGRLVVVDRARAESRTAPESTFKIAHSIVALEVGAVRGVDDVILYGGQPQPVDAWERDMSMREALPLSAVPIYRELARRIGPDREREWLDRFDYGDEEVGEAADRFWLGGPLEISPVEQTGFLRRLAERTLPASRTNQDVVADLLVVERGPRGVVHGKTGWRFDSTPQLGWWVGWLARPDGTAVTFALVMDMADAEDAPQRVAVGRELLRRLDVLA